MKKKKKDKKKDLFTKTKRVKVQTERIKTSRVPKKVNSPFKVVIRDWENPLSEHKELALNENSKFEISIDGCLYVVGINKKNRCLQFDTHETHLYLQPISVHSFLVKTNSKNK